MVNSPDYSPQEFPNIKDLERRNAPPEPDMNILNKPDFKSLREIILYASRTSIRAFLVGYLLRGGFTALVKLLALLKRKISFLDLLVAALGQDSLRFGTFFGSFTFLWKSTQNLLALYRKKHDKLNGFVAGLVAGVSLLVEKPERRVQIGLRSP